MASGGQSNKAAKKYSDEQRSCWEELYAGQTDNIAKQQASCKLFDQTIAFEDVRNVIMRQPHVKVMSKSPTLKLDDGEKLFNMVKRNVKEMNAVPRSQSKVVIDVAVAEKVPFVTFYEAAMIQRPNSNKPPQYTPPRILIELDKYNIPAYHGVRINTGLIITIPPTCIGRDIVDGKIVTTQRVSQEPFVIVPQITSVYDAGDHCTGIIPSMCVRDADDTGLFTINLTTRKDYPKNLTLQVLLVAYSVDKPMERVSIVNPIQIEGKTSLFKGKDNLSGRAVKNPRIKFMVNDYELSDNKRQLQMATYDHKTLPILPLPHQTMGFKNIITLFSSRKREWMDRRLVTITGIFNPKNKTYANAHIVDGSLFQHNTHCLTFITNRVYLFSQRSESVPLNARILNGAFSDVPNYSMVNKRLRDCVSAMRGLFGGLLSCKNLLAEIKKLGETNPEYNVITLEQLITMFDYDRIALSIVPNLIHRITGTHEQLFATRINEYFSAYSVEIKTALCMLAYAFMPDRFKPEELDQLSLRYSKSGNKIPDSTSASTSTNIPISTIGVVLVPSDDKEPSQPQAAPSSPPPLAPLTPTPSPIISEKRKIEENADDVEPPTKMQKSE